MSKKKPPRFGEIGAPGFSELRMPNGERVAVALSRWRRYWSRMAEGENLGWLDRIYLVPTALARSWARFYSVDLLHGADLAGKKKVRLRGTVGLDGCTWAVTGECSHPGEESAAMNLDFVALTELVAPETVTSGVAGRLYNLDARMAKDVCGSLGTNFFAVGPVYPKAGNEPLALGYNARVFPVEGLELGQWFALDVRKLDVAA